MQVDDEADEGIVANLAEGELWDLTRPLVGDCKLTLLKYDDPESKTVSTKMTVLLRANIATFHRRWEKLAKIVIDIVVDAVIDIEINVAINFVIE